MLFRSQAACDADRYRDGDGRSDRGGGSQTCRDTVSPGGTGRRSNRRGGAQACSDADSRSETDRLAARGSEDQSCGDTGGTGSCGRGLSERDGESHTLTDNSSKKNQKNEKLEGTRHEKSDQSDHQHKLYVSSPPQNFRQPISLLSQLEKRESNT